MTFSEFTYTLDQLRPYTDYLYFHVKGEPLFHPELAQFLAAAAEKNFKVTITTNGVLLPEKGEILLDSPAVRQVNLSLHSFTSREGVDSDRYFDACFDFARKNSKLGRYTTMRFWTLNNGRTADPGTIEILRRINLAFPGHDDLASQLRERSVALGKGIFVSFDEEFVWPKLEHPFISDTGFCHGLRQMIGILSDGTVVPCCLDADGEAPLGNIFKTPLREIIENPPFSTARASLYNRKVELELCKRCQYRKRFD